MEDKVGKNKVPYKFGNTVVDMFIRFFRWIINNAVHGILAVVNCGSKTSIPKIKNDLLLEPAVQLASRIRRGELSSETLVRAYIDRIIEVNDFINAVVDSRFSDAVKEAREVDQLVKSHTLSEKEMAEDLPLLGIPFTAKEALVVKGLSNTGGLVNRKGMTADKDCESVKMMRSCGAIPVAVSVVPELCLWWESFNKLHGRVQNPYNLKRSPGGSSGGEGALIASAASIIGVGSDLGGSIRLPAFFNGIFGHKPTQGLVPVGGEYPPLGTELQQYFVAGPMVRYAADLKLVLSALIGKEATLKLELLNPVDLKSIKVYYMFDNGGDPTTTPVSSDIRNGMKRVVNLLSEEGFSVKELKLKCLKDAMSIWVACISNIKDQKMSSHLQENSTTSKRNFAIKEICKWMLGQSKHAYTVLFMALFQDVIRPLLQNRADYYIESGEKMKQEFLEFLEPEPAVFLYPTFTEVAPYLKQITFKFYDLGYCAIFNIAALPITQCPLGLDSKGLPFGMQIVTAPNNDRFSIALAEYIEKKIGGWVQPS